MVVKEGGRHLHAVPHRPTSTTGILHKASEAGEVSVFADMRRIVMQENEFEKCAPVCGSFS